MSTFMFGRYNAIEDEAAFRGKRGQGTATVAVEEDNGEVVKGENNEPLKLTYSGFVGNKVLALFPAEALAAYTYISEHHEGKILGLTASLEAWFWLLVVLTVVLYIMGRFKTGHYKQLLNAVRDGRRKPQNLIKFLVAEPFRILIAPIAFASWICGAETEMAESLSLPTWMIPKSLENGAGSVELTGVILFAVAFVIATVTDKVGFKSKSD